MICRTSSSFDYAQQKTCDVILFEAYSPLVFPSIQTEKISARSIWCCHLVDADKQSCSAIKPQSNVGLN